MRKKLLSLALALVMCLGLAVPAMAAMLGGTLEETYGDGDGVTFSGTAIKGEINYYSSIENLTYP